MSFMGYSICHITHWGRNEMDSILQNVFSSMKMYRFSINISRKFVPKGPISNIPALVQIMAWRRPGDKPLSEPVMTSLQTSYMHRSTPTSKCDFELKLVLMIVILGYFFWKVDVCISF